MRFTIIHVRHCHMLKTSLLQRMPSRCRQVLAKATASGSRSPACRIVTEILDEARRPWHCRVGSGGLPVGRLETAAGGGASEAGAQGGRPHGRPTTALDLDRAWLGAGGGGLAAQHGASGSERGRGALIWPFRSVSGLLNPFKAFSDQFNDSFDGF